LINWKPTNLLDLKSCEDPFMWKLYLYPYEHRQLKPRRKKISSEGREGRGRLMTVDRDSKRKKKLRIYDPQDQMNICLI